MTIVIVTDEASYEQAFELASNVQEEKLGCRVGKLLNVHGPMPCGGLWAESLNEDEVDRIVLDMVHENGRIGGDRYTDREVAYIRAALRNDVTAVLA